MGNQIVIMEYDFVIIFMISKEVFISKYKLSIIYMRKRQIFGCIGDNKIHKIGLLSYFWVLLLVFFFVEK